MKNNKLPKAIIEILVLLFTNLFFFSCDPMADPEWNPKGGMNFVIAGTVTVDDGSDTGAAIKGIEVRSNYPGVTHTDGNGYYEILCYFPKYDETTTVEFVDIDGDANGGKFESYSLILDDPNEVRNYAGTPLPIFNIKLKAVTE